MSARRPRTVDADSVADAPTAQPLARPPATSPSTGISARVIGPHSRPEAEEGYVAARNAWTAAMRAASSGRPADMASLAITQEAYEAAAAERARWISGERDAIKVGPDTSKRGVNAAVAQELAWRRVQDAEAKQPGFLARLGRKLRGH